MNCQRPGCGHPRESHTDLAGCTALLNATVSGDSPSSGAFCACLEFVPEATGRTIPARATDPGTSHKATANIQIKAGTQRTLLLQAFDGLQDATDEEAMENAQGVSASSEYAKRCSELREAGYIEPTGDERPGNSGQARIVCRITDAGEAALQAAGHGVSTAQARRRMSRLSKADARLLDRVRALVANPNGADGKVVLLNTTANDLVALLDRLS
jgi:hypothetical protein